VTPLKSEKKTDISLLWPLFLPLLQRPLTVITLNPLRKVMKVDTKGEHVGIDWYTLMLRREKWRVKKNSTLFSNKWWKMLRAVGEALNEPKGKNTKLILQLGRPGQRTRAAWPLPGELIACTHLSKVASADTFSEDAWTLFKIDISAQKYCYCLHDGILSIAEKSSSVHLTKLPFFSRSMFWGMLKCCTALM